MEKVPMRNEIDQKYKWNVEDLYKTDDIWENEFEQIMAKTDKILNFKGKLGESFNTFNEMLKLNDEISKSVEKSYVYTNLRFHEDTENTKYQAYSLKSDNLLAKYSASCSYIVPEILSLEENTLKQYIEEEEIKHYSHFLNNILREKSHILSDKEEQLLANFKDVASAPSNIFSMINDADMKFPDIHDDDGNLTQLTKGRYIAFLKSQNRIVRKEAYDTTYKAYSEKKNTISTTYYSNVKADVFYSKTRKYNSSLTMALSDDNIPENVYSNLCETVEKNVHLLHYYIEKRKKILKLDELYMYDLYVPLVKDVVYHIKYEEAIKLILEALKPLGKEYCTYLKQGFENGWVDVYENTGKRGGAYSWGSSASHPFVLMNYDNSIDSLFTLVHEMGHAMHSFYTWKTQPYIYSGHKIFTAEVASILNESLLMDYVLKNAKDESIKKYVLNYYLDQFRGTFFRQTLFAQFEKETHELVEAGTPLTVDTLNGIYKRLNETYYKGIIIDKNIELEWARIPHFYNAFYVYQYSTGFAAAVALSKKIIDGENNAASSYIEFLKSGNSDYSINLLKKAGVDMSKKEPVESALTVFEALLKDL